MLHGSTYKWIDKEKQKRAERQANKAGTHTNIVEERKRKTNTGKILLTYTSKYTHTHSRTQIYKQENKKTDTDSV